MLRKPMSAARKLNANPGRRWSLACALVFAVLPLGACSFFSGSETADSFQLDAGTNQPAASAYTMEQVRSVERGAILQVGEQHRTDYQGRVIPSRSVVRQDHGLVISDSRGSAVLISAGATPEPDPSYADARELKLKVRELSAQLIAGLDKSLAGKIALPTAFVLQDDFERTSSLGRFMVEQMYYEFNQRGLKAREYRLPGNLEVRDDGEFILGRQSGKTPLEPGNIYLVGTYYTDQSAIFINARLITANGDILRAGQIIMRATPLTKRMMAQSGKRAGLGSIDILDFKTEARPPSTTTVFDMGLDIH